MTTMPVTSFTTADILALKALGEATFSQWYPHWRNGDPMPTSPPEHILQEARELALQHRMAAACQRGQLDRRETVQQKIDSLNRRMPR